MTFQYIINHQTERHDTRVDCPGQNITKSYIQEAIFIVPSEWMFSYQFYFLCQIHVDINLSQMWIDKLAVTLLLNAVPSTLILNHLRSAKV